MEQKKIKNIQNCNSFSLQFECLWYWEILGKKKFYQVASILCHCCNVWSGHITQTNSGIMLLGWHYRRRAGFVNARREWMALSGSSASNKHEQISHLKENTQLTCRRSAGHPALPSENDSKLTEESYSIYKRPRNHDDNCIWKWEMCKVWFKNKSVE